MVVQILSSVLVGIQAIKVMIEFVPLGCLIRIKRNHTSTLCQSGSSGRGAVKRIGSFFTG